MIVSTAAKALLQGPKVSYGDSRARPVIGGQSQGVEWAKGKLKEENRSETCGGRELAKVSFSDICGQHTWRRKLAWVSRLEPFAEPGFSQPALYLTFPSSNYPEPSLKEIELSDASTAIPSLQRAFKMCQ